MTRRRVPKLRSESGQSTVEFAGTITWLILAALFAWQLALVGWTWTSAANAARTAVRLSSRLVSDQGVRQNLKSGLAGRGLDGATVTKDDVGNATVKWTVHVPIPIVLPGIDASSFEISQAATMPVTG